MTPTRTARHEAAHVAMALFHGFDVQHAVTVGRAKTALVLPVIGEDIGTTYGEVAHVILAGMVATRDTQPSDTDCAALVPYAHAYRARYGATRLRQQESLASIQTHTLIHDPDLARAIEALASTLDRKFFLNGSQAQAIAEPHIRAYHQKRQAAARDKALAEIRASLPLLRAIAQGEVSSGAGLWAAEPGWLRRMQALLPGTADMPTLMAARKEGGRSLPMVGSTAVIPIRGVMSKGASLFSMLGLGTDTTTTRLAIREATVDPQVESILLAVDSGGGEVSGTQELSDDVKTAGTIKRVEAYLSDLGASAALWSTAHASRITSNASAMVGSIGTIAVLEDSSERMERLGVKVLPVTSGAPYKAVGIDGTPVTAEGLAYVEERVRGVNAFFQAAMAKGRRLSPSQLAAVSDGKVHLAANAVRLGLIDEIGTLEGVLSRMQKNEEGRYA